MSTSTRRGFIALSATGVATGAAAVALAPAAMAADGGASDTASTGSAEGPFVAYVHDPVRGEVTILRGEREVVVHDPALVRRLRKHV